MRATKPLDAVVLLSGTGTTFQNLYDQARQGTCAIQIRGVVASKSHAYGVQRARQVGIPVRVVNRKDYFDSWSFSEEVMRVVMALRPDLIVMAGWMSKLILPEAYIGKCINIHPALLPKFGGKGMYGTHVHQAVLDARERETGCTVHFVDNEYDSGPVILQRKVPVLAGDTPEVLQARVQLVERNAYPEAINMIADGRIQYAPSESLLA